MEALDIVRLTRTRMVHEALQRKRNDQSVEAWRERRRQQLREGRVPE